MTSWEGVRNYQARNYMREMKEGDGVLQAQTTAIAYASNADPSGVVGLAKIARESYPDHYAWRKGHKYYDAKTNPAAPTWGMVDVAYVERFKDVVSLAELKETKGLENMKVVQKGSRLSVQPVAKSEYDVVVKLGRRKGTRGRS